MRNVFSSSADPDWRYYYFLFLGPVGVWRSLNQFKKNHFLDNFKILRFQFSYVLQPDWSLEMETKSFCRLIFLYDLLLFSTGINELILQINFISESPVVVMWQAWWGRVDPCSTTGGGGAMTSYSWIMIRAFTAPTADSPCTTYV